MAYLISALLLSPLLVWQGLQTRRNTPHLPEPEGSRTRVVANARRQLLIIGDSSAAGVGVLHQDDALLGQLAQQLDNHVEITLLAQRGAKSDAGIAWLKKHNASKYDWVIIVFGVNDVTGMHSTQRWLRDQTTLRDIIAKRFDNPRIIHCGLPPMVRFPALAQPLRWHLGQRAQAFDQALRQLHKQHANSVYLPLNFDLNSKAMASDGFHPGRPVYREWAKQLANIVKCG